jgi:hypothetical protein
LWTTEAQAIPPSWQTSRRLPNAQSKLATTSAYDEELKLTPTRLNMESTFDVLVGKGLLQKRFTLHNDVFLPRSEFFRAARSAAWKKDAQEPTTLNNDDDTPEVFASYMRCVYLGLVTPISDDGDLTHDWDTSLVGLYVLADKLDDLTTANLVIDRLVSLSDETDLLLSSPAVNLVYSSTTSGSPLRALIRDQFVYEAGIDYFDTEPNMKRIFHCDFFRDIAAEYLRIKNTAMEQRPADTIKNVFNPKISDMARCRLHQHDAKRPKCTVSSE